MITYGTNPGMGMYIDGTIQDWKTLKSQEKIVPELIEIYGIRIGREVGRQAS